MSANADFSAAVSAAIEAICRLYGSTDKDTRRQDNFEYDRVLTENLKRPDGPPRNNRYPVVVFYYDTALIFRHIDFNVGIFAKQTWATCAYICRLSYVRMKQSKPLGPRGASDGGTSDNE